MSAAVLAAEAVPLTGTAGTIVPWMIIIAAAGVVPAFAVTRQVIASPVQLGLSICALTAATFMGGWGLTEIYVAMTGLTLPYFVVAIASVATSPRQPEFADNTEDVYADLDRVYLFDHDADHVDQALRRVAA
ncbi:MAG: hypothetical protein AAGI17_01845 [Planctomycetota bacterium]